MLLILSSHAKRVTCSEPEPGGLGDEEPQIEKDIREALRLCTNLRSFSWVYAAHDVKDNRELADDLDILRALPQVNKLLIRTAAGIGEEEWRKLAQFPGLRSLEIWSHRTQVPQFPGWSANLQETLVSLDLGSDIRRNQRLPCTSRAATERISLNDNNEQFYLSCEA